MENYICINGKKAELTEKQLKALGIELPKANPFERVSKRTPFYFVTVKGGTEFGIDIEDYHCNKLYEVGNYCTDKAIMEQRALHETLNRLLWRYSMEHDGDKINWKNHSIKIKIYHDSHNNTFGFDKNSFLNDFNSVYFFSTEIAEKAIEEIIKPFMKAHPDFKF